MASQEIQQLISRLEGIRKDLGGPLDEIHKKKDVDEFNSTKLMLAETINFITQKQNERDETLEKVGRNLHVIKAEAVIRDKLEEAQEQLGQLQHALKRQKKSPKKYPESQTEIKQKQYENYKSMIEQMKIREEGGEALVEKTTFPMDFQAFSAKPSRRNEVPTRDLDTTEQDALKRFQEQDKKLDEMLDDVEQGLDALRNKALMMGDQIAHQEILIEGLDKEVEKGNQDIESANKKLKKVLYEYKKPTSFCMDVVCFLILMGLIGVIIKIAQG